MQYAAFLRSINVGTHNRIKMAEVRKIFSDLGFADVRSYLQSGNVTFQADRLPPEEIACRIEASLTRHGLKSADAMVQSLDDLQRLVALKPFLAHAGEDLHRFVLFTQAEVALTEPLPFSLKEVTFVAQGERALLAIVPRKPDRPVNVGAIVEARWKTRVTGRFWNVVDDLVRAMTSGD